jgi:hypothetical protein
MNCPRDALEGSVAMSLEEFVLTGLYMASGTLGSEEVPKARLGL